MGDNTAIEWTDHSFNPWTGCQAVSPACDNCYAERLAKRSPKTFGGWGPHAERKRTSAAYWRQPLTWNRMAEKEGRRFRVFCASMADVFDNAVPAEWREDLWALIHDTPHLDWLLLTKRPQNIWKMLPGSAPVEGRDGHSRQVWRRGWPNVWLGTTVENQAEADRRIPHLLAVPAAKRFLSCEPLLGPVRLATEGDPLMGGDGAYDWLRGLRQWVDVDANGARGGIEAAPRLDWIIAGGESGPKARPSHPDWFRSLRDQCRDAGVPFFLKQIGEWDVASTKNGYRWGSSMNDGPAVWVGEDGRTQKPSHHGLDNPIAMWRRGKKAAGAMLDGREWREIPGG